MILSISSSSSSLFVFLFRFFFGIEMKNENQQKILNGKLNFFLNLFLMISEKSNFNMSQIPQEIYVASSWWASRTKDLSFEQENLFRENLSLKLLEKYKNHWWNENLIKGSAYRYFIIIIIIKKFIYFYRAIIFDENMCDPILSDSAELSFISKFQLRQPQEAIIMWVDPGQVEIKYLSTGKSHNLFDNRTSFKIPFNDTLSLKF